MVETPCIEWTGSKRGQGYGKRRMNGKSVSVHRLAWEAVNGPIPEGMDVLHHCDNPSCHNEGHLFLGTDLDNARDRSRKGRSWRGGVPPRLVGENHGRAKLSEHQVAQILQFYGTGDFKQRELAELFGVAKTTIGKILRGESR